MDCPGWYLSGKMEQLQGHTVSAWGGHQPVDRVSALEFQLEGGRGHMWRVWVSVCARPQWWGFQHGFSVSHRRSDRWYGNIHKKKKKKERRRKVQRDCLSLRVRGLKMLHLFSSVQSSSQHWHNTSVLENTGTDLDDWCSQFNQRQYDGTIMACETTDFIFTFWNDYCNYSISPRFLEQSSQHSAAFIHGRPSRQRDLITRFHKHTNTLTRIL